MSTAEEPCFFCDAFEIRQENGGFYYERKNNSFLGTEPVGKLLRTFALPCVISLLVAALYNIVDQLFIANAPYLGSNGNAGNTVVFPLTVIALAFAMMLGDGCCTFVASSLGAGLYERARKLMFLLLKCEAITGAVFTLVFMLIPGQMISIFGSANESVYYTEFAIKAIRIYLCPLILTCINKGTFIFLQSMGKIAFSTIITSVREIIFGAELPVLLSAFMGLDGVLWWMVVADIITFFICVVIISKESRELKAGD